MEVLLSSKLFHLKKCAACSASGLTKLPFVNFRFLFWGVPLIYRTMIITHCGDTLEICVVSTFWGIFAFGMLPNGTEYLPEFLFHCLNGY